MDTYHFNPDSADQPIFSSSCAGSLIDSGPYTLAGKCSKDDDGRIRVSFQLTYEEGKGTEYFLGHLDDNDSIVGYRSWAEDVSESKFDEMFILRRVSPEIMRLRPSPAELKATKYRSLWQFAIQHALQEVQRKAWSWSHFAARRRIRKRYIKLNISYWTYGRSLTAEEQVEFLACRKALTPSESIFYRSIREYLLTTMPRHQ